MQSEPKVLGLVVTYCAVGEEEVTPVVVHRGEHGEEEGEQQHHDEDDHNHPGVQSHGDLRQNQGGSD